MVMTTKLLNYQNTTQVLTKYSCDTNLLKPIRKSYPLDSSKIIFLTINHFTNKLLICNC